MSIRETKKIVDLGVIFTYPSGGQQVEAMSIVVCEPGFEQRTTFRRMQGFVAMAQTGLLKKFATDRKSIEDADESSLSPPETSTPAAAPQKASEPDAISIMQMGLTNDEYCQFCEFVQRELTGKKTLAYIGDVLDQPLKERVHVTEEAWINIVNAGSMEVLDKVISAFTSFFFSTPPAKAEATTSGTDSPSA
jgi:hypothetical protein